MERIKQTLGFLLLIIAVKMISALPGETKISVLYYIVILGFCIWMAGTWVTYSTAKGKKLLVRFIALIIAAAIQLPTLNDISLRVDQVAIRVEVEIAGPGVENGVIERIPDNKEAAPIDTQIRPARGAFKGPLPKHGGDIAEPGPFSELGFPGERRDRGAQQLLKGEVARFEGHRIDIGDVIADDLHGVPQVAKTAYA